jgi:hypothetical protein
MKKRQLWLVCMVIAGLLAAAGTVCVAQTDCTGLISVRPSFTAPGNFTVKIGISKDCVPEMACFTVGAGRTATITNSGIISGGYNCATNAYINDPGLVVVTGCCSDNIVYTCGTDRNGKFWESGNKNFGPGTYTLMPAGGRNFGANVTFNVR